jgi:preprotein translocase subunit SecD
MLRVFAHILLGGFLALSAVQAGESSKQMRRVSLLYQIDTGQIAKVWLQSLQRDARRGLMEEKIGHRGVVIAENQVRVILWDASQMDVALPRLKKLAAPLPRLLSDRIFNRGPGFDLTVTAGENGVIVIEPTAPGLENRIATALSRTVEIVRHRADPDEAGEASAEPRGQDRILIQVPEPAAAEIKARVGVTAKLTFHLVDISLPVEQARAEGVPPDDLLLPEASNPGQSVLVHKEVLLSGDDLMLAQGSLSWHDRPAVNLEFNRRGAATLARISRENIGKPIAIVLDDKVLSAPRIVSEIPSGRGEITGGFSVEEANRLALLLRSGALPAPLTLIEERNGEP